MQLATHIQAIKTAWNVSGVPLYFQLAPETAMPPFAVFRFGTITPGEQDNTSQDWETTAQLSILHTSDINCANATDSAVAIFERGSIAGFYSSTVQSAELDVNYGDQMALWQANLAVTLRWTV